MLELNKNSKLLLIVGIVIVIITFAIILYFILKPSCKKFHYKPYAWTAEDMTNMGGGFPSGDTQKNYCEQTLKKFWKGPTSSSVGDRDFPGCSTAWCCTKECDN